MPTKQPRPELADFARWVLDQRTIRGWTQAELAERAGVLQDNVSRWENAIHPPRQRHCIALAEIFRTEAAFVLRLAGLRVPPRSPAQLQQAAFGGRSLSPDEQRARRAALDQRRERTPRPDDRSVNAELTFGEWLGDRLDEGDVTQQDLAAALGIKQSTISRWMRDERRPRDINHVHQLALIFDWPLDDLLRLTGHITRE